MKVGVVSDTHLSRVDPSRFNQQKFFEKVGEIYKDVDLILHAGDVGSFEVLNYLERLASVKAVYGNMDDLIMRRTLPEKIVLDLEGLKVGLTHGSGAPWGITGRLLESFKGEKLDCLVFGHTHEPFNKVVSGVLLFNPGSPTDTIYASRNSLGVLYLEKGEVWGEIFTI